MNSIIAQIKKNLTVIFRNRISFILILLAPFLILFLVGNLFVEQEFTSLKLGYVVEDEIDVLEFMDSISSQEGVYLYEFKTLNSCIRNVEYGITKSCLEFKKSDGSIKLVFHADYSQMNLVYWIINYVTRKYNEESGEIREQLIEGMLEDLSKISQEMSSQKPQIKNMNNDLNTLNSVLSDISKSLDSKISFDISSLEVSDFRDDIDKSKNNIGDFSDLNKQSYAENVDSLDSFVGVITSLKDGSKQQKETVDNLHFSPEGSSCYDVETTDAFDDYLNTNDMSYIEDKYLYCECFDQFETTIDDFSDGLSDVIGVYDEIITELESSKDLSYDSYVQVQNQLDDQMKYLRSASRSLTDIDSDLVALKTTFTDLEKNRIELKKTIDEVIVTLDDSSILVNNFYNSFDEFSTKFENSIDVEASSLESPLKFGLKSLFTPKSDIVFYFPLMFFMIIMFISIIFSTTFINSEVKSPGRFRVLISPMKRLYLEIGNFLSLFLVIFVQSVLLLAICVFIYSMDVIGILIPLLLITILGISVFVMIGILIGYIVKKDELAILIAIGSSILMLFYSSVIKPVERISSSFHYIIYNNPFMVCLDSFRKILFFDVGYVSINMYILTLILEVLILAGIYAVAIKILKR